MIFKKLLYKKLLLWDGVLDAKTKCHTYNFVAIDDTQLDTSHGCELIEIADPLLVKLLGGGFRSRSCLLKCLFTINCPFHLPRTNNVQKPLNKTNQLVSVNLNLFILKIHFMK